LGNESESDMEEQIYRESVQSLMNGSLTFDEKLGNFALGLVCETGELAEKLDNAEPDKILDEFSDCRWYFTANEMMLGITSLSNIYALPARKTGVQTLLIKACKFGDLIKKVIYHKHPLEQHIVDLEMFLWQYYVEYRHLISMWGFTDEQVKQFNHDKLSARYKGLKFTTEQSINRKNEIV
jgi:hypothetical protein